MIKFHIKTFACCCAFIIIMSACGQSPATTTKNTTSPLSTISASGELESKTTAMIAPPAIARMWQYQIKSLVAENTQVTKGQMIVSFDSQKISQRLFDKQAKLNTATKELENKKRKEIENEQSFILTVAEKQMAFDKAKRRYDIVDNSRSENERQKAGIDLTIAENDLFLAQKKLQFHYDNTQLNIQLSQNKIDRLTNEIKDLNKNIKQLTVTAPIAGMVLYKKNWDGEKPAVGSTTNFGQPIIEIAVIEQMQLKVQIAEPDSGKIFEGQSVKISLDGTQEIIFQGKITSLGRIFRDKSAQDKKRIIDAVIAFDSPDLNVLKPGMTARIEIITQKKTISKGDKS